MRARPATLRRVALRRCVPRVGCLTALLGCRVLGRKKQHHYHAKSTADFDHRLDASIGWKMQCIVTHGVEAINLVAPCKNQTRKSRRIADAPSWQASRVELY